MRKSINKRDLNNTSSSEIVSSRLKEGLFIFIASIAVFLLLALATYEITDPGWSRTASGYHIANAAGKVGAYSADLLLFFFGYFAYLFPIMVLASGILIFKKVTDQEYAVTLWFLRVVGLVLVTFSGCGIINLLFPHLTSAVPGPAGGIVGNAISVWLTPSLSYQGTTLFLLAMTFIGITVATGMSWLTVLEIFGKAIILILASSWRGLQFIGKQILAVIERIQMQRIDRQQKQVLAREKFVEPIIMAPAKDVEMEYEEQQPIPYQPEKPSNIKVMVSNLIKPKEPAANTNVVSIKQAKISKKKSSAANYANDAELPNLDLLDEVTDTDKVQSYSNSELENLSREVEARLLDFGCEVQVVTVSPGPIITRFEMTLAPGLKVSKISGLAKDLARSLSVTSVRVVEIIPGKAVVGLEIPNQQREIVRLREILEADEYQQKSSPLTLALGKDIAGMPVTANLAKMPHLLVAGTTGSGKSVGVNAMLLSLLYKSTPDDVRLILIDPKMLELAIYDGIGHLLTPVVTDMNDAANALRWCVAEMERRYQLMASVGVRNLAGFNQKVTAAANNNSPIPDPFWVPDPLIEEPQEAPDLHKLPHIVVIIDEFADMMMVVGKKVEELIARIAQKARAAGIHMILATQRPSVDVITGLIKANVPTRISYQVSSRIDSRTILDQQGAEQLLGHGDMLYLAPGTGIPQRVHGAFVSDEEVHQVVNAIKEHGPAPDYIDDISQSSGFQVPGIDKLSASGEQDPLYDEAVQIVTETRKASISYLQRRLKIGYNRSARLIEEMESAGVVSTMQSNGSREVLANSAPLD